MSLINEMNEKLEGLNKNQKMGANVASVGFIVVLLYLLYKGQFFVSLLLCTAFVVSFFVFLFGAEETKDKFEQWFNDLKAKFMSKEEEKEVTPKPEAPKQEDTIPPAPQC